MADLSRSLRRTLDLEIAGLTKLREEVEEGPLGDRILAAVELARSRSGRVIVTGVGKSGIVGHKMAATLASTGTPAHFLHPSDASHGDLGIIQADDVVFALSWSGESAELSDIIDYTRRFRIPLIAITADETSTLGTLAEICLTLPRMPEACPNGLAPTTSTTMQIAVGDAVAICLLDARGFSLAEFREIHPGGKLGARLKRARDLMHSGDAMPLVPDDTSLSHAIVEMTAKRFGIAGVTDSDGNLIGVVTDGDLRRAFQAGFVDRPVKKVMTPTPRVVSPDIPAQEVLAEMNSLRITSVFVLDGKIPIGIIHIHDLLRSGVA